MDLKNEVLEEAKKVILDPASLQAVSLNKLSDALDGKLDIVDPNNPFTFLMENTTMLTSSFMSGVEANMRRLYPILANNKEDLYHHINSTEINDVMATPGEAVFNIFLNIRDIINYGVEETFNYNVTIPKYSFITVDGIVFTILNDIVVKYFKNGGTYVEAIFSDLDLAIRTNKIMESGIVTNSEGVDYLILSLPVKQVKRFNVKETLLLKQPFIKDIVIDGMFTYIKTLSISASTNSLIELDRTFSEFVYNPNKPTILIKPMDNIVRIEVPSVYIINNSIHSFIDMDIYTTLGNIETPLSTLDTDEFELTFNMLEATTDSASAINNINCFINASTYVYGGKDEITFEELKTKVIQYSTGDNIVPITIDEVITNITNKGFKFMFATDTIVKREFAISKYIDNLDYLLQTNIDLFTGNLKLRLNDIHTSKLLVKNDSVIISPFQRFRKIDNNLVPLSDIESDEIADKAISDMTAYNKEEYFINPYLYILDYKDNLKTRVYDINQPIIENIRSLFNNSPITPVEFTDRIIKRNKLDFEVFFIFSEDNKLDKITIDSLTGQLDVTVSNVSTIKYTGKLIRDDYYGTYLYFKLPLEGYVSKDDKLLFTTGEDEVESAFVDIETNMTLTLYTTDEEVTATDTYDVSGIVNEDATAILYKEVFDAALALNLNNIFRNYNVSFLERKFKTYEEDVYLTYETDIYELDEDGTVKLIEDETTGELELILKYKAGDSVLDDDGNPIVKHKAGDVILNDNDEPIIDYINGLEHNIDVMVIEDSFTRTTDASYRKYFISYLKYLTSIITDEIPILEDGLIENTKFKFTALNNLKQVTLKVNGEWANFDNFIIPTMTINIFKENPIIVDEVLEAKLSTKLQELLSDNIILNNAEEKLKEVIGGDVISVRLSNITDIELSNIEYKEDSGRFILRKNIIKNNNSDVIVKSEIKLNVVTV
jgi:hypothetical protein